MMSKKSEIPRRKTYGKTRFRDARFSKDHSPPLLQYNNFLIAREMLEKIARLRLSHRDWDIHSAFNINRTQQTYEMFFRIQPELNMIWKSGGRVSRPTIPGVDRSPHLDMHMLCLFVRLFHPKICDVCPQFGLFFEV